MNFIFVNIFSSCFFSFSKAPTRLSQSWLPLKDTFDADDEEDSDSHQNKKRMKLSEDGDRSSVETESIYREVDYFAKRIISTWEDCYE